MQEFYLREHDKTRKFNKHWQFCVGSGHAALALRADYGRLLRQVHEELGIERVRFHGIFCDDMHTVHSFQDVFPLPVEVGIREYSFRQCATAYDNLLEAGVKPFVELGFMPSAMAKEDIRGMFFYKPNICMPKDDREWVSYIQAFVRFLLDRYGEEEVRGWYFEVWNEPDLVLPFFHGTQEDYFHLYAITARAIKEVDEHLKVGGPATSGSKWVKAFVDFSEKNQVPVDFVTTHQYAGDPIGGIHDQGGTENADVIKEIEGQFHPTEVIGGMRDISREAILPAFRSIMGDPLEGGNVDCDTFLSNAPIVKKQAKERPVFYTEWNTCATFSAYTNDTRKVAAYDVKMALGLDGVIDGSSIWCFSDIFEEFHQFPEEFHGGFGLMTQSGIKKPVYYALEMLNRAGQDRYVLQEDPDQEVGIAAFNKKEELQVILFRQKLQNAFELPKEEVTISVEMEKAPAKVILERIDEEHCNPLKIWEEMGSPQVPNKKQLEEIQRRSASVEENQEFSYKNGRVHFQVALGVNDVYFLRLVR